MPDYSAQLNQERTKDKENKKNKKKIKKRKKITEQASKITDIELSLVLCLCLLKDVLDWLLLFAAGIGLILSRITNLFIAGILWLWCITRLHKFPTKRFVGGFIIEMIPVIGTISPSWTAFIISIWVEQKGYTPKFLKKIK